MPKFILGICTALLVFSVNANPVRMIGIGSTEDSARHHAFQRAIEKKLGTLVVSELEVRNQNVRKDDIFNYTAGYVDNFKILSVEQKGDQFLVEADVWVSESKLRDRILSKNNSATDIDGNTLHERRRTYLESKFKGDQLITRATDSYPHRAFDIDLKRSDFKFDEYRQLNFVADFSVKWSKTFIDSLSETLRTLEDSDDKTKSATVMIAGAPNNDNFFTRHTRKSYYFNDRYVLKNLADILKNQSPVLVVTFNQGNRIAHSSCVRLDPYKYFSQPLDNYLEIKLYNNDLLKVTIPVYNLDVKSITDFKFTIISKGQC